MVFLSMKKKNKPLLFDRKISSITVIILSDEEVCKITLFYMDVYLLVHLIMEYILLRIAQYLLGLKREAVRPLLGAAFTSICNLLLMLVPLPTIIKYFMTYILVTFAEIKISFKIRQKRDYIKAFVLLYALAFMAGGFLESIYMNIPLVRQHGFSILTLFAAGIFLFLFIQKLVSIWKEYSIKHCLKNVEIYMCDKVISCMGLLDTGNHLFDPISGKPVLIVEREELKKNGIEIRKEQYRVIPYHSLGKKDGILEGFVADKVRITDMEKAKDKVEAKVIIGIYEGKLSNNGSYQMILHPLL